MVARLFLTRAPCTTAERGAAQSARKVLGGGVCRSLCKPQRNVLACTGKESASVLSSRGEMGMSPTPLDPICAAIIYCCYCTPNAGVRDPNHACWAMLALHQLRPFGKTFSAPPAPSDAPPLLVVLHRPAAVAVAAPALVEEGGQWSAPSFDARCGSVLLDEAQKVRPKALDVHRAILWSVRWARQNWSNARRYRSWGPLTKREAGIYLANLAFCAKSVRPFPTIFLLFRRGHEYRLFTRFAKNW